MVRRVTLAAVILAVGLCFGQFRPGNSGNLVQLEGGLVVNEDQLHTARETDSHSSATPNWTNTPGFEPDVFTFTRVIFKSDPSPRSNRGRLRWLGWWVDYPDADLNFSYRLQQLTSITTDPDGRVLKLTDPTLFQYPLLYMEHAGYMRLSEEEVVILRKYLLCGGALFVNDFWGSEEWDGFAAEIKRVLADNDWTELSTDHPVFRCVYDLRVPMQRLQVPTIQFWNPYFDRSDPESELQ